eukprot:2119532-Amphidinium_carterae.1
MKNKEQSSLCCPTNQPKPHLVSMKLTNGHGQQRSGQTMKLKLPDKDDQHHPRRRFAVHMLPRKVARREVAVLWQRRVDTLECETNVFNVVQRATCTRPAQDLRGRAKTRLSSGMQRLVQRLTQVINVKPRLRRMTPRMRTRTGT